MSAAAASTNGETPLPLWAHAVGGSLGSALALLLLYPLERVRIELQSECAVASTPQMQSLPSRPSLIQNQQQQDRTVLLPSAPSEEGEQQDPLQLWVQVEEEGGKQESKKRTGGSENRVAAAERPSQAHAHSGMMACFHSLVKRGELYKGASPIVATLAISNFVFYFLNESMKRILLYQSQHQQNAGASPRSSSSSSASSSSPYRSLVASSLAGIANVLLTNPLWVANLALVTGGKDEPTTLIGQLARIIRLEGWAHLWNGTGTSVLLVSNPVIQFVLYEHFKSKRLSSQQQRQGSTSTGSTASNLSPIDAFVLGALTKAIATIVTYPLQLAQTILRLQHEEKQTNGKDDEETKGIAQQSPSMAETTHYKSTVDCLIQLYRQEGVPGLFTGIRTKLVQTVLTAAVTFLTYEQILRLVHNTHKSILVVGNKKPSSTPTP